MGRGHFLRRGIEKALAVFFPLPKSGLPREHRDLGLFGDRRSFCPPPLLSSEMTGGVGNAEAVGCGCGYWGPVRPELGVGLSTIRGEEGRWPRGRRHRTELRGAYVKVMLCCRRLRSPARRWRHSACVWLAGAHCDCALLPDVCLQCLVTGQLPAYCALAGHPRTRGGDAAESRNGPALRHGTLQLPRNYEAAITNPLIPPPFPPP